MYTTSASSEEPLNTLTHGFGLLLALIGCYVMGNRIEGGYQALGVIVYLSSLVGVYLFSTLSHWAVDPRLKFAFRQLDQGYIYLLVVGTFTPFALLLTSPGWMVMLSCMWIVALIGFFVKAVANYEPMLIWPHLVLGWMPIMTVPSLLYILPIQAGYWMVAGGVFYTAGTLFLINDEDRRYFHAWWHIFVIAGSLCHYYAILMYVIPVKIPV